MQLCSDDNHQTLFLLHLSYIDHQRFRVFTLKLTTLPFSLTMATKAATTAAVVRPPRHAVNSETYKLNSLTRRTSPTSTHHSISEGVRPSPDEHQSWPWLRGHC